MNQRKESSSSYLEGADLVAQIAGRNRNARVWHIGFMVATVISILVLIALLYNVLNQAFGLVAVENSVSPSSLVMQRGKDKMIAMSKTSENDDVIVKNIVKNPDAIGFFGYAYYKKNSEQLNLVKIDGKSPLDADYPLSRPLYLYTTADALKKNSSLAAFVTYYLETVGNEIESVGYFASPSEVEASKAIVAKSLGVESLSSADPASAEAKSINIVGSSTLLPLTQRIADQFLSAGYKGKIDIQGNGSTAGLGDFCAGKATLIDASRPISLAEIQACRAKKIVPLEIRVGTDAIAVVVNKQNQFAQTMTVEQLRQAFTSVETWQEIDTEWPSTKIEHQLPGKDSGTLDFFAGVLFNQPLGELTKEALTEILAANITSGVGRKLERQRRFFDDRLVFEKQATWDQLCASIAPAPPSGCSAAPRDHNDVLGLVLENVIQPKIKQTWSLVDSLLHRGAISAETAIKYPSAELEFRSWISPFFVTNPQSSQPEIAGVRTAILGSLGVILITILFSFPVGVGAAIYLEEYANKKNRLNGLIELNINNLAGVPSIIYGMLGLAIFVRVLEPMTSGYLFSNRALPENQIVQMIQTSSKIKLEVDEDGNFVKVPDNEKAITNGQLRSLIDTFHDARETSWGNFDTTPLESAERVAKALGIVLQAVPADAPPNTIPLPQQSKLSDAQFKGLVNGLNNASRVELNGRTILSAGLTLGLLILPVIIINAQEAIRAVPKSLRQASFGLGATKWQTIWSHVLPMALPGILTGTILAMSRAIGETAPIVVIGASTFIQSDPSGPFSKFTVLPIQIYQWTSRPQPEFKSLAAAAIVVLLILLVTLNGMAVYLRNRYAQKS